jgi:hypothetical protein
MGLNKLLHATGTLSPFIDSFSIFPLCHSFSVIALLLDARLRPSARCAPAPFLATALVPHSQRSL